MVPLTAIEFDLLRVLSLNAKHVVPTYSLLLGLQAHLPLKNGSAFRLTCRWTRLGRNRRGINKTDWIRIDRELYDRCLDRRDCRRKSQGS